MEDAVRPSSMTKPRTCRKHRYSSRSDTAATMPDRRTALITAGQRRVPSSGTPQVIWARKVLALTVEVVKRTDDVKGFAVLPRRWVFERTFAWISKFRRCVRDYETLPAHHEAIIHISMIMTMSRRLARTGDW